MSAHLQIITAAKERQYQSLLAQIKALTAGETDLIANLANIIAVLKQQFNWWWAGIYFVRGSALVLGPFQGPVACTRIPKGKGVCGTAWQNAATIIVDDVHLFKGHIACSNASKSEIVVPLKDRSGVVIAVLDIDSEHLSYFDTIDKIYLEKIAAYMAGLF